MSWWYIYSTLESRNYIVHQHWRPRPTGSRYSNPTALRCFLSPGSKNKENWTGWCIGGEWGFGYEGLGGATLRKGAGSWSFEQKVKLVLNFYQIWLTGQSWDPDQPFLRSTDQITLNFCITVLLSTVLHSVVPPGRATETNVPGTPLPSLHTAVHCTTFCQAHNVVPNLTKPVPVPVQRKGYLKPPMRR